MEQMLSRPEGILVSPHQRPPCCAVLVLGGSSGRVETDRVRLLAAHGAAAMSIRWFGDRGQPPGICELPLETFTPALDRLAGLSDHLAVVGISKGAEAALLLGVRNKRVRVVAALSPSSVVWANVGPGLDGKDRPMRSSWSDGGRPLPFVPYDDEWNPPEPDGSPAYRGLYERSLATFAERVSAAAIPVERISADVLVAAGEDDQVWPSELFAKQIVQRRARHGMTTQIVTQPGAGHSIRLPFEPVVTGGLTMARGGTPLSDDQLGKETWDQLIGLLHLRP
jgi:uncharacterized protein